MLPTRLVTLEHAVTYYHHIAPQGLTVDDVTTPGYWAHVTYQMKPGFRIVVDAVDRTWTATLIVRSVSKVEAHTEVLFHQELGRKTKVEDNSVYDVVFKGPKLKWCVTVKQGADTRVLESGLETREDADDWRKNNVMVTAPKSSAKG